MNDDRSTRTETASILCGTRREHAGSTKYANSISIEWSGAGPGQFAYFIVSPNQAYLPGPRDGDLVKYRAVTDCAFRRVLVVERTDSESVTRIRVISLRDRIALLGVVFDGPMTGDCLPRRVADACDDALRALLESRAGACGWAAPPERRFFVQFDAWTRAELRLLLGDRARAQPLSDAAKEVFVERMPPLENAADTFRLVPGLALALETLTVNRVYFVRDLVESGEGTSPPPLVDDWADLTRTLARYLKAIFDATYPACRCDATPRALIRAFALFAMGALRFLDCGPRGDLIEMTCNDSSALNAEPESSLFFSFAEFALEAARRSSDRSAYWIQLARAFAALQEVYCHAYGPAIGPRAAHVYDRSRFQGPARLEPRHVESLVDHYERSYRTPSQLHYCMNVNAAWYLHDFDRP